MTWLSTHGLADRIDGPSVPLVLCGPMLRRVEPTSVSVFVALKHARDVTLEVYAGLAEPRHLVMTGTARTVTLGQYLHVAVVTATALPDEQPLTGGLIYRYDLRFAVGGGAGGQNLADLGMLSDPVNLGFVAGQLPSFALPPNDLNRLRIVHGSCRKPHGESLDALEGLEMMIRSTRTDPLGRPHQLFLTGDQIYADDVADALLLMLMDAGDTLLGWPELELRRRPDGSFDDGHTVVPKGLPGPTVASRDLLPGHRSPTARTLCGFTVHPVRDDEISVDRSHLLGFGEYAAMYLFAWSRALWPTELPLFDDVYRGYADTVTTVGRGTTPGRTVPTRRHQELLDQTARLRAFQDSLHAVQRALANVSTYMMFDDHEITDDWFLNRRWCQEVLSKPLGLRVLQNGLAAFAVFQAWGNAPDRYTSGLRGRQLLDNLAAWSDLQRRGASGLDPESVAARTEVNALLGMPADLLAQIQAQRRLPHGPGTLDWHYQVRGPGYEVIVLDTRTWRAYPGAPKDFAALISDVGFRRQISDLGVSQAQVTLVVSPVPVIGVPVIEGFQDTWLITTKQRFEMDAEAWVLQAHAFEYLFSLLSQRSPRDQDGTRRGRVVLLSGDVHYGFAARVQHWATSPYEPTRSFQAPGVDEGEMVAVQFTASSLKNEIGKTRFLHGAGVVPGFDHLPVAQVVAWNNQGGQRNEVGAYLWPDGLSTDWVTVGNPARSDVGPLSAGVLSVDPHWSYRVDFLLAESGTGPGDSTPRGFTPRFVPVPPPSPQNRQQRQAALAAYLAMAHNHRDYVGRWGDGKEIVGMNNIGEISFVWNSQEQTAVQNLWWRLQRYNAPELRLTTFPLTTHHASLRFDDPRYPEPNRGTNR